MMNSYWIVIFYIFVTVISAFLMSLFLLAIVEKKKGDKMMKYRFIFAVDWIITIIFIITRAITQPRLLITHNTLFVITDTSEIAFDKTVKSALLCIGESFYATYFVMCAVHFYFRFRKGAEAITVEKRLNPLRTWEVAVLSALPVFIGVISSLVLFFFFSSTPELTKILEIELKKQFPEADAKKIVFFAMGGHGGCQLAGLAGFMAVVVVSTSVMVSSLRKSIRNVENLTRNKYRTIVSLTIQIFIPFIFLVVPIIFFTFMTICNFSLSSVEPVIYLFQLTLPAFEVVIFLIIIRPFRKKLFRHYKTIRDKMNCCKKSNAVQPIVMELNVKALEHLN